MTDYKESNSQTRSATPFGGALDGPGTSDLIATLDLLAKEAYSRLGDTGATVFLLGDGVQRFAVDGLFDLLSPGTWSPANLAQLASAAGRQATLISSYLTSPEKAQSAWQELRNKIEIFVLVRGLNSILGLPSDQFVPLPQLVERTYGLPDFQALWAVEGLGHYYTQSYWQTYGRPTRLLWEENAPVPAKSLLMLHAGMGLFFADYLLGSGAPTLTRHSPPSEFRVAVQQFVDLARDNSRDGYLGPVIESLGLTTRDFYPATLDLVSQALMEVAPELAGYFWHGAGRALYFSRRYFLPVLTTVWAGIDKEARTAPQKLSAMAGLAWAVTIVNMRQPEIMECVLQNYIQASPLQDGFVNGVVSSTIMRQDTTPDIPFVPAFYEHQPRDAKLATSWNRLITSPSGTGLSAYYPVLKQHNALGLLFQYQNLSELVNSF
jgi:hypothetical protein